jgi:hypothetical protein
MWYKNGSYIGIRRKFGEKKQVFSFGQKCGLSKEVQWSFGCMVLKKLDAGQTEQAAKDWADNAVGMDR